MNINEAIAQIDLAYADLEELKIAAEKAGNEELVDKLCDVRITLENARGQLQD